MSYDVEIKCVNKADGSTPYQFITHVGGTRTDGKHWKLSQEQVILSIKNGGSFHITVNKKHVPVIIATYKKRFQQRQYLKTALDSDTPEHLLKLPECP